MKEIYAIQNDTVDAICWREYGRSTGVVEQVLAANPHLSEFGPF
ncbi:tail protein X, partial [Acinetobacter baumannii]